ncbi:MAG: nucleotidyltransferase family protein [Burkholderiaceae bacterium]
MDKQEPLRIGRCGAMVLAAGRGERMRPLTDTCPKPLLTVGGKPLLQWAIEALARDGVRDILINTDWLGDQIEACFADPSILARMRAQDDGLPSDDPIRLAFSREGRDFGGALETAGGIARALPQLADPFWLLAGDIFAPEFRFCEQQRAAFIASDALAHIWLVPNPAHNPQGDFALSGDGLARNDGPRRYTYSTIGLFRHALFTTPYCDIAAGNPLGSRAALAPLLRLAAQHKRLTAALYTGPWTDVGTPERLAQLQSPVFPELTPTAP